MTLPRATRPRQAAFTVVLTVMTLATATPSSAEILVFTNGRTMSVKSYRMSGAEITVGLRNGGEATFDASIVARIVPDEVADVAPAPAEGVGGDVAASAAAFRSIEAVEGRPFATLINTVALEHGVDPVLVHAVVRAESNYQPGARSQRGARGLMQVMPTTGAEFGVRNLYDPRANLQAGVGYLKSLLEKFALPQALAAYNAGPEVVRRYGGIPPFPETRVYVDKVLSFLRQ